MTTLPKVVPRVPRWKVEIFNTRYNWQDAKGEDVHAARDEAFDLYRCGWLQISDKDVLMLDIDIRWDIRNNPEGTVKVAERDAWMFGCDMLGKAQAIIFYEEEGETQLPDASLTEPSKILFYIDNTGIEDHVPHGTVSVYGQLTTSMEGFTETIEVNGPGLYITENVFGAVYLFSADMDDEGQGSSATMSVWGRRGVGCGIRECRVYCDTNNDGIYGLIFGGYIHEQRSKLENSFPIVSFALSGYAEFLQCNEYIAGYRGMYRCQYYSTSGESGTCSLGSQNFQAGGSSCYVGDWDTAHPNGNLVSTGYRCEQYYPDITKPLPNDGWTYDPNYAPEDEDGYEWFPRTYFRALMAACNMCNSLEEGKPQSRLWDLPMHVVRELQTDIDETLMMIDMVIVPDAEEMSRYSRAICETEIFKVVARGNNGIAVERGAENTLPITHPAGTKVYFPKIAWSKEHSAEPPLAKTEQLQDSNLKHTIMETLCSLAENATTEVVTTEYIPWVDCFKQLQFTNLDGECVGYDSRFEITVDDIIENPSFVLSAVVNMVSAQVNITEDFWVYCELSTDAEGLEDYSSSRSLFGTCSEEVTNVNLTAMEPTDGKVDFKTFATNFLKIMSFPRLVQTITVDSFVPDEHYWKDVDTNDPDKLPYLDYTDDPNKHINLLGTTLIAPDFFKPKDNEGNYQSSTFWVEGIRYQSRVDKDRAFLTTLIISRPTLPEEWGVVKSDTEED